MGPIYHATSTFQALVARYGPQKHQVLEDLTEDEEQRLAHYMKLTAPFSLPEPTCTSVPLFKKTAYSYDFWRCLGRSKVKHGFHYEFGDVRHVPNTPTFVKSRPIRDDNENSVLLPLEMERHFKFVKDKNCYEYKRDLAVFRGACYQPWRKRFLNAAASCQYVDAGDTARTETNPTYWKSFLSIEEQLHYKIIISLEGNDVASNLKWAMASNSVVIMPKPKFETWFCESFLVPDHHYYLIKDDYSDLGSVIEKALSDIDKTKAIIHNANTFCSQYLNMPRQYKLGGLVTSKYLNFVSQ